MSDYERTLGNRSPQQPSSLVTPKQFVRGTTVEIQYQPEAGRDMQPSVTRWWVCREPYTLPDDSSTLWIDLEPVEGGSRRPRSLADLGVVPYSGGAWNTNYRVTIVKET